MRKTHGRVETHLTDSLTIVKDSNDVPTEVSDAFAAVLQTGRRRNREVIARYIVAEEAGEVTMTTAAEDEPASSESDSSATHQGDDHSV